MRNAKRMAGLDAGLGASFAKSGAGAKRVGSSASLKARASKGLGVLGRGALAVALMCAFMPALAACSAGEQEEAADSAPADTAAPAGTSEAYQDATANMDLEYTKRDQDPSYDEAAATIISLLGDSASVEGAGAVADGASVTINAEGTYVVSGELADGQLMVEAPDSEKVQVVLAGVAIHNENGPAIYVKNADKCFITLAEGTDNVLTDGADYELEEDSDEPYATLFSKDDLTLNGTGSLTVTSAYRHAVCSKDDLVITGGTYVVTSVEDALRGRDCVKILDGTFALESGEDAVKSNNDEEDDRGFVVIDGGTFAVSAGDDAFHAETVCAINGGVIDIATCYEGFEGEKVFVNGGQTHMVATDDGINAAARNAESGDEADPAAGGEAVDPAAGGFDGERPDGQGAGPAGHMGDAANMPQGELPSGEAPEAPAEGEAPEVPADAGSFDPGMGDAAAGAVPQMPLGEAPGDAPDLPDDAAGGVADPGVGAGGMTMPGTSEECLIEINGGYAAVEAAGDGVDSNGYLAQSGGVLLISGPDSGADSAIDYELSAEITGGTLLAVGSIGMAENLTGGTQPFVFSQVSGQAGQSVALVGQDGTVLASLMSAKQFSLVIASAPGLTEDGVCSIVVGGTVADANADGYASSGAVEGGASTEVTASTTPTATANGSGGRGGAMTKPDGNPPTA